jgi:hypothetical protein
MSRGCSGLDSCSQVIGQGPRLSDHCNLCHCPQVRLWGSEIPFGTCLRLRANYGVTGSYSESEDTLRGVETSQSTCLCSRVTGCVVKRRWSTAGVTRPGTGSLHPVAIRAAVEATKLLKPLVQRVARRLGERAGRNPSER